MSETASGFHPPTQTNGTGPRVLGEPHDASTAEAVVLRRLREQLPEEVTVICGQRITSADLDVEIDMLILWPGLGIVVLEVKGGQVSMREGRWCTAGRHGSAQLQISPLEQAMRAKHALGRWLRNRLSTGAGRMVQMASLPFSSLRDWTSVPDAPRDLLIDGQDLGSIGARIEAALRTYYSETAPLSAQQLELLSRQLRQTHQAAETSRLRAAELDSRSNALTAEQERILSVLRYQTRAELSGGPGSGKTHLALLKARQLTREGLRVAVMCYSRGLARFMQLTIAQWAPPERPAYVGLFHDLPLQWGAQPGADDDSHYWEVALPQRLRELAGERDPADLFDAIIVDEGQDFSNIWWQAVESCLRAPATGILYAFTDEHQRIFDRDGAAPITMNPFYLGENLRNADTIVESIAGLASEPQIVRLHGGERVEFVDVPTDAALETADDVLARIADSGDWELNQIALLTTGPRHPVQREVVAIEGFAAYWDAFFAGTDAFYGHVLGFKGLDREVVVLCANGFRDPQRAREMMYVGMSRARFKLVVVGDMAELAELTSGDVDAAAHSATGARNQTADSASSPAGGPAPEVAVAASRAAEAVLPAATGWYIAADNPAWASSHRAATGRAHAYAEAFYSGAEVNPRLVRTRLEAVFGTSGADVEVRPPFTIDYGSNISIGERTYIGAQLTALDVAPISIGADCQIGPNVQLLTPIHPLEPGARRTGRESAEPISIGDNVWLGGGVTICPGVTIGNDAVIGAGAVVTEDVPAGALAAGVPARVIRQLG